ncbi:MAG: FAD-dependent oxidoreductase [Geminicoccaceae bacterium]|nr:FAD-dependent oxidoreductase [Geminicoccaceae bacterium]
MRAVVVGAGIMGLGAAWALQRDDHEVVVLEQGTIPNPQGSSVDQHRLIRYAYGAKDGYAAMVGDAFGAWDRLWGDLGTSHYQETGTLAVARAAGGWVEQSFACLERLGVPVERLAPAALRDRLPMLDVSSAAFGLWTLTGGVLFAERIIADLARLIERRDGVVRDRTRVQSLDAEQGAVVLEGGERVRGDVLIIAAGPWTPDLLPELRGQVTPSRQVLAYLEPPEDHLEAWRRAPMLLDQIEASRGGFYAVPPVAGTGLKIGDHGFSLRGHPDRHRDATDGDVHSVLELAGTRLRDFERYRIVEGRTCFYSVTEGERFVVEPRPGFWLLAGFSGHGFKFGPLIGERVTDALAGRRLAADVTRWARGEEPVTG